MSNPNEEYKVKKAIRWNIGSDLYPMTTPERGYCLLINNISFDYISNLPGGEADGKHLRSVFNQLGFNVVYKENLTAKEMDKFLHSYSKKPELSSHEALIVIILSHGNTGIVCGTDCKVKDEGIIGGYLHVRHIIEKFNNEMCITSEGDPILHGKPKIFFFDCCRGDDDAMVGTIKKGHNIRAKTYTSFEDIFIGYGSFSGYATYQDRKEGSYFATALATAIAEYACDSTLDRIFNEVVRICKEKEIEINGKDGEIEITKQIPTKIQAGWDKDLYFNPGLSISCQNVIEGRYFLVKELIINSAWYSNLPEDKYLFSYRRISKLGPKIIFKHKLSPQHKVKVGDVVFEINGQCTICSTETFDSILPPEGIIVETKLLLIEFEKHISSPFEIDKTSLSQFEQTTILSKLIQKGVLDEIIECRVFSELNVQLLNDMVKQCNFSMILRRIYLVRGKDEENNGIQAWQYILVDEDKVEHFLTQSATGNIELQGYGRMLKNGWGYDPPQELKDRIAELDDLEPTHSNDRLTFDQIQHHINNTPSPDSILFDDEDI